MNQVKSLKMKLRHLNPSQFKGLQDLCAHSKNLYNQSLYHTNEHYTQTGNYLGYGKLDKAMRSKPNLEGKINYQLLKAGVSQQILRRLDKNYTSYFALIKQYKTNPTRFKGVPRPPKYIKNKYYNLIYDNQRFQIKNHEIILDRDLQIRFFLPQKLRVPDVKKINQIEIIPRYGYFEAVIVYEIAEKYIQIKPNNHIMAIDLGLNNVATCVTNGVCNPFIINGKPLKSINQYYNKHASKRKSGAKKRNNKNWTNYLENLTHKRNNKINDYLHKTSAKIVAICLKNNISKVIIGNVAQSNYKIKLGKRNNQNFVNISLGQLVAKLRTKLERHGITVIIREESYTSRGSFIDNDALPKQYNPQQKYNFSGKRVKRGLYIAGTGAKINADVNGAYNLLRKEIPKFSYQTLDKSKGIEGWLIPHKLVV